jgi:hypothetical protein
MNGLQTTYHYSGPRNARRLWATCAYTMFSGMTGFANTTIFAGADARGMRQHGHFGLA